jgi:hypothetical protein
MAISNRRFMVAALVLPLFLLMISGRARANLIYVNTLDGNTDTAACTLPDAIESLNIDFAEGGCVILSQPGADVIVIGLTGTIPVAAGRLPLTVSDTALEITTFGDGPVVINGSAKGGTDGGTMFVSSLNKFLKLTDLTFANGLAEFGGAIFSQTGGDVDIKDCLFENNTASFTSGGEGGAIFEDTGRMEVTNSTFFGNDALMYNGTAGGAIYVQGFSACATSGAACSALNASLKLTNSTFEHNYAKSGSAIFNAGTADVKGNIFADHLEGAGTGIVSPLGNCAGNNTPPVTDENYNVSVDDSCDFSAGSSLSNQTAAQVNLDPNGLQNNGGPSFTVALKDTSSVAYGLIPVANCTEQDSQSNPLGTDQRLFGRPDPGDPDACDSGAFELNALGAYTLDSHRVQIARNPNTANSDTVNINVTFTANGDPDCDLGVGGDEDALNNGVGIGLFQGTCASLPFNGLFLGLSPFVTHTVNKEEYGTFYQTFGPVTVSARMVSLFASPPPPGVCGAWTLNLEVGGLNTKSASVNLPGVNPFALLISDQSDIESCFDITNAIVGNQIPPPSHGVRRVRRR